MKGKHRAMKKARDELDALREGQDKAVRLEVEVFFCWDDNLVFEK